MFAVVPIRRGSRIAEYSGPVISGKKADRLNNRYLFELGDKADHVIDGSPKSNKARYVNHSCRPNAWASIHPGEEITFDYGRKYFEAFLSGRRCRCTSCRKRRSRRTA
jgi:uncharacterized protein